MAAFGTGALLGGYLMNKLVATTNLNFIVGISTAAMAIGIAAIALYPVAAVAFPVMFAIGIIQLMALGSFVLSVQTNVPSWVRGRAIAIYFMAY
jgi:hypothetical protein